MSLVEQLHNHVRQQLHRWGVSPESRLLCAVSGGVDSVVLLDILFTLARQEGFALGIVHADHGLRGESSRKDAEFVQNLAQELKLPLFLETLPVRQYAQEHGYGVQAAARKLRYAFFRRSARRFQATHFAVAHTADDNAETVLLHLLRGTGLEGLGGIPPQRSLVPGCLLIRPLLAVRKAQLLEYAHQRGLSWREDPSNRDRRFRRNRIRWELLPTATAIVPKAVENINRCSAVLRSAGEALRALLDPLLQPLEPPASGFFIDESAWDSLPEFFRLELLRLALRRLGAPYSPTTARLMAASNLRRAATGKRLLLTRQHLLLRERQGLSLVRLPPPMPVISVQPRGLYRSDLWELEFQPVEPEQVQLTPDPWTEFVDAERLPPRLLWRPPQPGDRFHPLGMPRELKLGDFLTNQRLPHWRRLTLTVLSEGARVLWLCGVRLSDEVKISPETRHILRLQLRAVPQAEPEEDDTGTD